MDATNDELKVNPVSQDLTTSKHNLAEGSTLEQVVVHQGSFCCNWRKPESCEETIDLLLGLQNHGLI